MHELINLFNSDSLYGDHLMYNVLIRVGLHNPDKYRVRVLDTTHNFSVVARFSKDGNLLILGSYIKSII